MPRRGKLYGGGVGGPFSSRETVAPVLAGLAGIACFSVMDALMKKSSLSFGVFPALLWRNLIGAAIGLPLWLNSSRRKAGGRWPARRTLAVHALRSAVVAPMAFLFFTGLLTVPMAVGMALSFIAPLIALYLAAAFLGEPVTRRAQGAMIMGLAGVGVIAAGRGLGSAHGTSLVGIAAILGSAVLYAINLVVQRHQAQLASPVEVAFFQNALVLPLLAPLAPWYGAVPGPVGLAWVCGAAALAFVSLLLLSWAYARAEAHRLLPVEYSAFVWSALMGYLWFAERLDAATCAGVVLIVAGCWIGAGGRAEPS